jgi:hypothetical protein
MSEMVLLTYAQSYDTNEMGSKFYNRNDTCEEKWNDLMTLYGGQHNTRYILLDGDDDTLWKRWMDDEMELKSEMFETSQVNIGKLYVIFVFRQN